MYLNVFRKRTNVLLTTFILLGFLSLALPFNSHALDFPGGDQPLTANTFRKISDDNIESTVNISTEATVKNSRMPRDPFSEFFGEEFGLPFNHPPLKKFKTQSLGSGVVLDEEGYILTNNHVIQDADSVTVTLHNKEEFKAKIVGRDPRTDVALLKIEGAKDLHPAKLGDSDDVGPGDWVVAIGSPYGPQFSQSVTVGVVSAKGRNLEGSYYEFIQIDAAINPGNSGGPLFNLKGEVIGINTAIYSRTGGFQGLGFAIPISLITEILPQLKQTGSVTRGWLGVSIQEVTKDLAEGLGLPDTSGAVIAEVLEKSPAEQAGLLESDIVLVYNGEKIDSYKTLPRLVARTPIGKKVPLEIWRNGEKKELTIEVAKMPEEESDILAEEPRKEYLGVEVANLDNELRRHLDLDADLKGVVILSIDPGSPADEADLQPYDVIMRVQQTPVTDLASFKSAVENAKKRDIIVFQVKRRNQNMFKTLRVPKE